MTLWKTPHSHLTVLAMLCACAGWIALTWAQKADTVLSSTDTVGIADTVAPPDTMSGMMPNTMPDIMPMVLVPAGPFTMGSDCCRDEMPIHTVYLDSFYIDQYEVTNGQYTAFVEAMKRKKEAEEGEKKKPEAEAPKEAEPAGRRGRRGGPPDAPKPEPAKTDKEPAFWSDSTFNKPNYPVVGVNWSDAKAYCVWLGKRLPTEAEWEKAARDSEGGMYPWGNVYPDEEGIFRANYDPGKDLDDQRREDGFDQTAPAGSFPDDVSPYGAYDMAGNVSEWVADRWGYRFYAVSPDSNPSGPSEGSYRVVRGGSWQSFGYYVRSSVRAWADTTTRAKHLGFRCARCTRDSVAHRNQPSIKAEKPEQKRK